MTDRAASPSIEPRQIVGLVEAGKVRCAVVLRVLDGPPQRLVLVYGTRTPREEWRHVRVDPQTPEATALGLHSPTYFYEKAVRIVQPSALGNWSCPAQRCPPELFLRLRELAGFKS